jgi:hypothetical protein
MRVRGGTSANNNLLHRSRITMLNNFSRCAHRYARRALLGTISRWSLAGVVFFSAAPAEPVGPESDRKFFYAYAVSFLILMDESLAAQRFTPPFRGCVDIGRNFRPLSDIHISSDMCTFVCAQMFTAREAEIQKLYIIMGGPPPPPLGVVF